MARRDVALEAQEEARLVGRVRAAMAPDPVHAEVAHPHAVGQALQAGRADDVAHPGRRHVVRAADHRREKAQIGGAQRAAAHRAAVQVGGQQHRLEDARRRDGAPRPPAVQPLGRADGERDGAAAVLRPVARLLLRFEVAQALRGDEHARAVDRAGTGP